MMMEDFNDEGSWLRDLWGWESSEEEVSVCLQDRTDELGRGRRVFEIKDVQLSQAPWTCFAQSSSAVVMNMCELTGFADLRRSECSSRGILRKVLL